MHPAVRLELPRSHAPCSWPRVGTLAARDRRSRPFIGPRRHTRGCRGFHSYRIPPPTARRPARAHNSRRSTLEIAARHRSAARTCRDADALLALMLLLRLLMVIRFARRRFRIKSPSGGERRAALCASSHHLSQSLLLRLSLHISVRLSYADGQRDRQTDTGAD